MGQATRVSTPWETRAPTVLRNSLKSRRRFTCSMCDREVDGWEYLIGFDPIYKVPVCSQCWALPRTPPMRPIGGMIILG